MTYSVADYIAMVGDAHRTGAYARALQSMVTADSVVLDLGAGFGYFAILAAKLGARHVYAIEPEAAIRLGPALARANGVADRVTFFEDDSRLVELPERANLLVEDIRGIMPLHRERIALLTDARRRLLTPDAKPVAVRDRLWAAPARHPDSLRCDLQTTGPDLHGVDLSGLRSLIVDGSRRGKPQAGDLLLPGAPLGTLELATVEDPRFDGTAHWQCDVPVTAEGFILWFDAELSGGERFTSCPGPEQSVHGCLYLPLREPLCVPVGTELALRFGGIPAGGDYTWTWECAVRSAGHEEQRTPRQTSFGLLALELSARADAGPR